ncbi:hypothetical protein JK359_01010 [Streptomyces actinomycinicus]|uniref:Secreted protein n=1 Tax=Streptomyces actinomycinicus TaxID=1695166 RepID=A0A937EE65_9ACTN|nr:hypothetical protein [Streptomyces actinomycinicus]MBL1080566.1 hypothetical protein [Streptomyces actinomycinicus]
MRKFRSVAVLVAALGTIGLVSGTAHAGGEGKDHGDKFNITQSSHCKSHDLNLDVLGEVGLLNGLLGNALNGEGNPGAQATDIGSTMGCNNSAL